MLIYRILTAIVTMSCLAGVLQAQPRAAATLGSGPWTYDTAERNTKVKVSVVTRGLSHPWGIAFLPDGGMLVTERPGKLRVIRNGVLDPTPVADLSQLGVDQLFDIALHPTAFGDDG